MHTNDHLYWKDMSKDDRDELYDFYAKNSVLSSFIFENS